jgi:SAM-dependent MidA family methyltransferase
MIANEVLDVMPVKLFVKRSGVTHERGIAWRDDRLVWSDRPASGDLADAVARLERELEVEFPEGYASELALAAPAWMRELGRWLKRGALLAIDYGFPRREYYHPQRLMGTLMCHYRHRAHADPLWLPGLNDVTAHVDFSAAADAAHGAGLDVLGYTSQAHFLLNCGVLDLLKEEPGHRRVNEANRLLSEAEMGELFKVLAVGRGVVGPLRGFAQGDRLHTL